MKSLERYLTGCLQDVVEKEVFLAVSQEIQSAVTTDVYGKYKPTQYQRTGELASSQVIKKYKINGIGIEIRHERMDGAKNVSDVVEKGYGYDWKYSKIAQMSPYPRPFIRNATFRIKNKGILLNALKRGLKKRFGLELI